MCGKASAWYSHAEGQFKRVFDRPQHICCVEKTVFGTVWRRARLKGSSADLIRYIVWKKTGYGTVKRGARLKGFETEHYWINSQEEESQDSQ